MRIKAMSIAAVAGTLAAATASGEVPNPNLGRSLAATCANCHGTNGVSAGGTDNLAGVPKADLLAKLTAFKAGTRPGTIMPQLAKGYTDAQFEALAGWFAAQPPQR